MPLPVRGIVLPVLAALCLTAAPGAAAQFVPPSATPPVAIAPRVDRADDALALAGPVDPAAYVVGPGDVFVVSIGGGLAAAGGGQTRATVTADGLLVLPQAGTFQAAGRSLADLRAEARAALRRQYQNVPTDVALAVPRRFSVFVSGAVPAPGRQTVSALGRVEDAVDAAAGGRSPLALADYATLPSAGPPARRMALRNVRVTSPGEAETRVDLLRFYATGDLAFNPHLRDGAVVTVPTFDPVREGVAVGGDVDRPGVYDWRPDDTAAALVAVAGGAGLDASAGTVRRTRVTGARREVVEVPLADAATLDLRPRDQLSIRAGAPDAGLAQALGAVAYPGAYPIIAGQTTLDELVEAAGGLAPDALVRGAYLERPGRPAPVGVSDPLASSGDRPANAALFDSTVTPLARLSDLGLAGRRYYAEEYARTPRLSVDLDAALAGREPVVLRDGDRLVIPHDLGAIRVSGQVGAPGLVPFEQGLTAGDYVARAGGQGPAATTIYTVDARTGLFRAGADTPVDAGDAVFVDRPMTSDAPAIEGLGLQRAALGVQEATLELQLRREEREQTASRRQFLFQAASTVIAAVSTVATVYLLTTRE